MSSGPEAYSTANAYQVGGSHYKTAYEHWDLVLDVRHVGYLEGCATKYVARWRKKGGLADLKKALHYHNKALERAPVPLWSLTYTEILACVMRFADINQLEALERAYIAALLTWQNRYDLESAREHLLQLMDEADKVPAEDSNRHAVDDVDPQAISHSRG